MRERQASGVTKGMSAAHTSTGAPAHSSAYAIPVSGWRGSAGSFQRSAPSSEGSCVSGLQTIATPSHTSARTATGYEASGRPASIAVGLVPPMRLPKPPASTAPITGSILPALPVGSFIAGGRSIERAIERVRRAEELGYDCAYATHIAERDSLAVIEAYAARTERINVGTGVTPIYSRTPVAMAQTAATIDELSGGRMRLGLGVSHKPTVEGWYGQKLEKPVTAMREYVGIVRAILRGDDPPPSERWPTAFHFMGYEARADLPIYAAALPPRMLQLAGEIADGVILWLCNHEYVRDVVVPEVTKGRERAGRSMDGFDVVAAVPAAVTEEAEAARARLRGDLIPYFSLPFYRAMIERSGYEEDVAAFDAQMQEGGPERAAAAISDRFLQTLTAIGSVEEAEASVRRYLEAGASSPCLGGVPGTDFDSTLEALAHLAAG